MPAWSVYVYIVLGITSALFLLDPAVAVLERVLALAILAVLAIAFWWTWIRQLVWSASTRSRGVYVVLLLVSFALLVPVSPVFGILQFSLFPQIFFALSARRAIVASLSIGLILAVDTVLEAGGNVQRVLPEIVLEVASVVALTMISAWIGAIIEQSSERQSLLQQLDATRAELATAEREAGTLEERARLSREIHDTLAQGFASVVTHLEAADALLDGDPPRARGHLRAAEEVARASLDEARGLVWTLRPPTLANGGLTSALERAAAAAAAGDGPAVEVTVSGRPRALHPDVEVTILRAAQEALANVLRHAHARRTTMTLTYFDDEVSLDVIDDGRGFDPGAIGAPGPSGGHGLRGMRERAEQLGGRLEIESAAGEGTAIALALPAPPPALALPAQAADGAAIPAGASR
jgi:signal transduction histidine kinase